MHHLVTNLVTRASNFFPPHSATRSEITRDNRKKNRKNRNGISSRRSYSRPAAAALALKNARALRAFRSANAVGERDAASTLPTRAPSFSLTFPNAMSRDRGRRSGVRRHVACRSATVAFHAPRLPYLTCSHQKSDAYSIFSFNMIFQKKKKKKTRRTNPHL